MPSLSKFSLSNSYNCYVVSHIDKYPKQHEKDWDWFILFIFLLPFVSYFGGLFQESFLLADDGVFMEYVWLWE